MRIVVLAGGVGGARFLIGLRTWARHEEAAGRGPHELTAVINTGDDMWLAGLRITPDLDSVLYALAGVNDTERGWGREGETERVSAELRAWGVGWPWFTLGDLDLGAHIARTSWLREGVPLHEVVARMSRRWDLGVRLLPATDDEVETRVVTDSGDLHFQEWWTRYRAALPAHGFRHPGVDRARPAPGVIDAIASADVVLLAPSNPVVSIGAITAIPGIRTSLLATRASVIGISPIIGGAVVRGMADVCLSAIGVETDAAAVARHYGPRRPPAGSLAGLLDGWLVDEVDASAVDELAGVGIPCRAVPLWMRDAESSAAIAAAAISLA